MADTTSSTVWFTVVASRTAGRRGRGPRVKVCSKAHLYQRAFEANWDLNDVLQPFPAWSTAEETSPAPVERIPVNAGRLAAIITGGSVTYGVRPSRARPGPLAITPVRTGTLPTITEQPAYSAIEGKVVSLAHQAAGGRRTASMVIVEDVTGERTAHCHLSSVVVGRGETVIAGQKLGLVGNTRQIRPGLTSTSSARHSPFTYGSDEKPSSGSPASSRQGDQDC
jgi:hypothetical protein